jgi:uncharacterized paraquat-inducible protein A
MSGTSSKSDESITLKHAVCPKCDYHIGAVEVDHEILVCPECGYIFALELPPASARPEPRRPSIMLQVALVLLFACVLVLTSNRLLVGLVALGIGLAIAIGFRLLRYWCLRAD